MANNEEKIVTISLLGKNNEKIKKQLATKVNIEQGADNKGKLLGIDDNGKVTVVDKPESTKISTETGNAITEKDDGLYVPSISETKISEEEGNAIVKKDDGLYVATPEEIKISKKENNQLSEENDGLYVAPVDLKEYTTSSEVETIIEDAIYTTATIEAHYEIVDSTTANALEVVADGTAADGQIDISSVTPLLDGVTVSEGDHVIWVEATEIRDAKFLVETDLEPYVAKKEIKVMTEEELLEKLGLSEEELQGLAQLISDTEVRIDKTYSSSKIYNELNRILEEGKTYTLAEIAKSSGASYKIASSTADMTSTKYIYLLANGNTYDMYICEEENTTPVKIGTTSVTLTDYYTKTECDERYVLATAFALLNNSIGDVSNLQTTSKIIVDSINEILASLGDITTLKTTAKDNITNAVNEVVDDLTETKDALGDIAALETTAKDNVVNAVNEVKKSIDEFETYVELTQAEYDALADDETGKLNGTEYRTTDTGRIYKNGMQYGGQEPETIKGFAKYKEMKEAGLIDPDTEYLVTSDENEILLNGSDVGYSNAKSGIQATTVQDAIDKIAESGGSGEKNVQSDWNETDNTADGFIKNKPIIPEAYDDTEVKESIDELNSDLSEYKDNGYLPKNLFNADNYGHYIYSITIGSDLTQISSDRYGVSGMLDGSKDITVSIVTGEVVALLWGIKNNKIAYYNDFGSITSKTYKGGQYDYWVVGFGLESLGTITSDIMKNNKCMAEYGSSATNYVPYFNSVSDINESLGDYGLDGIHNIEMLQGYPSNEDITATYNNSNYVCSKNTYECNGDDKIVVKNKYTNGLVYFYDSSKAYISESEFPCTAPTNAKYFRFRIGYVENITPQTVGKISVYINNAIDEIKNDLNELCNIEKVFTSENTTYTYIASEMHLENDHIYDIFLKGNYPTAGCGCCKVFVQNDQYILFTIAAKYIEFSIDSSNGTLTITNKYNGTQNTQLIVKKVV